MKSYIKRYQILENELDGMNETEAQEFLGVEPTNYKAEVIASVEKEFEDFKAEMLTKSPEDIFYMNFEINVKSELSEVIKEGDYLGEKEYQALYNEKGHVLQELYDDFKVIIDETISQLQTLKIRINSGNNVIGEIDTEIAKLGNENRTYGNLYAKQIIDDAIFVEKTDVIKRKITELRSRRLKLINEDEDERCIEQLRQIKRILDEGPNSLCFIDKGLFEKLIDKMFERWITNAGKYIMT